MRDKRSYDKVLGALAKVHQGLTELNRMEFQIVHGEGTGALNIHPFNDPEKKKIVAKVANNWCQIDPTLLMEAVNAE